MKVVCLSIVYNKFDITQKALTRFYELLTYPIDKHYLFNNFYPFEDNQEEKLKDLASQLKIEYVSKNKNLGLFSTIDYFCQQEENETLFIINEANSYVLDKGFDSALINAYQELKEKNNEISFSLGNKNNENVLDIFNKNGVQYSIENNGEKKFGREPKGFPYGGVNIASCGFLKEVANLSRNKYYGDPYKDFIRKNRVGYILRSHKEVSDYFYDLEDEVYRIYKMIVIYLDYKKSFEDYVKIHNENIEYTTLFLSALNNISPKIIDYIKYKKDNLNKI